MTATATAAPIMDIAWEWDSEAERFTQTEVPALWATQAAKVGTIFLASWAIGDQTHHDFFEVVKSDPTHVWLLPLLTRREGEMLWPVPGSADKSWTAMRRKVRDGEVSITPWARAHQWDGRAVAA